MRSTSRRFVLGALATIAAALAGAPMSVPAGAQSAPGQPAAPVETGTAIFAGGCFWCVESDFDKVPGVIATESGYIGGATPNPTYEQVSAGGTGHAEVVKITYDPARVSYEDLLKVFWRSIDPLTANAQFCDKGSQYRSAIFTLDERQRSMAEASKAAIVQRFKPKPVATQIAKAGEFYPAEDYHQDYYKKNPTKYKFYRWNCGRDARLQEVWGSEAVSGAS
jgi:peptide-methionine (S)-S-oxide reductase